MNPATVCLILAMFFAAPGVHAQLPDPLPKPQPGGSIWHVSVSGHDGNFGTASEPLRHIDAAIQSASAGDVIFVAGGEYSGSGNSGSLLLNKSLKLYGSYSQDFSSRDIDKHATVFRPDNKAAAASRKPLLTITGTTDTIVVNGFVFDMGGRNAYAPAVEGSVETGSLLLPPMKNRGQNATVTEACVQIPAIADGKYYLLRNNLFLNGAMYGVRAELRQGWLRIINNVFVGNRLAAIEVGGSCPNTEGPKTMPLCAHTEISWNTILFSWSRRDDYRDMGQGIRILSRIRLNIHHNIIAGNCEAGIDHTSFNRNAWLVLRSNLLFANKTADLLYAPDRNSRKRMAAEDLADIGVSYAEENINKVPVGLKLNPVYADNFLSTVCRRSAHMADDAPANLWRREMKLPVRTTPLVGKGLYAPAYPWREAIVFFGNIEGFGARTF